MAVESAVEVEAAALLSGRDYWFQPRVSLLLMLMTLLEIRDEARN